MNFMEMVNIIFPYTRARVPQPLAAATADRKQYGYRRYVLSGNSTTHVHDVAVFYSKQVATDTRA